MFHGLVEIEDLVPNPATWKLADRPNRASGSLSVQHTRSSSPSIFDVRWRLDKEELSSGFALVKQNLLHLFIAQGDEKRRRLIVDLEPPTFVSSHSLSQSVSQRKSGKIKAEQAETKSLVGLNADQEMAIEKVLQAQDYALILGTCVTTVVLNSAIVTLRSRYAGYRQNYNNCSRSASFICP